MTTNPDKKRLPNIPIKPWLLLSLISFPMAVNPSEVRAQGGGFPSPVAPTADQPKKDEPAPNNLNPNANPLFFPTKPQEVDIRVVKPVTLNQAIELALKNNKELAQARLTVERAQAQLEAERAALYPSLQTTVDLSRNDSAITQRQNEAFLRENGNTAANRSRLTPTTTDSLNGQVQVNYSLYAGGERAARIARSEREIRRNQLVLEQTAEQTRFNATDAYYELQRADARVAIAQAAIEDATQSLRDAQLLEQAGLGTRFSVLQAEVDLANANQDLTTSISNQRVARRRLAQILSLGQQVELTAADEIREAGTWGLTLDDSIVLAYKNRSELEQQLVQREISEQDRNIARASITPRVNLIANYNLLNNFNDEIGFTDGYNVGAQITWNFFDGGAAFAREREANRNIDIADTQFANLRNQVRFEVEQAYYGLVANRENIATSTKSVESATESLRLARLRFQAGVGTQTDVINSQRDLTDARSRYLQAIVDYNKSLNSLQRAVSNLPNNYLFSNP